MGHNTTVIHLGVTLNINIAFLLVVHHTLLGLGPVVLAAVVNSILLEWVLEAVVVRRALFRKFEGDAFRIVIIEYLGIAIISSTALVGCFQSDGILHRLIDFGWGVGERCPIRIAGDGRRGFILQSNGLFVWVVPGFQGSPGQGSNVSGEGEKRNEEYRELHVQWSILYLRSRTWVFPSLLEEMLGCFKSCMLRRSVDITGLSISILRTRMNPLGLF